LLTATITGTYHRTRVESGGTFWQPVVQLAGGFLLAVARSATLPRLSSIRGKRSKAESMEAMKLATFRIPTSNACLGDTAQ
jgi:hypothetical protein